jgi:hypothetical protein
MPNPDPLDQLREQPTPTLFRHAFGADAQRQRLEERQRRRRELEQLEELNRRRQYLAELRGRG